MPGGYAVQSSGSQAMTLTTEHTLATITASGIYKLVINSTPLVGADEFLTVIVEQKVISAGTRVEQDRFTIARGGDAQVVKETLPYDSPHELVFKLRQDGGTGRTIEWSIRALQTG